MRQNTNPKITRKPHGVADGRESALRKMTQYSRELGQQEYDLGIFPNWVEPETQEEYVERIKNRHEEQQLALFEAIEEIDTLTNGSVFALCEMSKERTEATLSSYSLTLAHSHTKTWEKRGVGKMTQSFKHEKTYKNADLQYFLSHLKEGLYQFLQEAQNSDLAYKVRG